MCTKSELGEELDLETTKFWYIGTEFACEQMEQCHAHTSLLCTRLWALGSMVTSLAILTHFWRKNGDFLKNNHVRKIFLPTKLKFE
jgi:hypothetical protein